MDGIDGGWKDTDMMRFEREEEGEVNREVVSMRIGGQEGNVFQKSMFN